MIERGLLFDGHRTALHTSPHLVRLEERFRIEGKEVTKEALERALESVRRATLSDPEPITYFEATTIAAFLLFAEAGCEIHFMRSDSGDGSMRPTWSLRCFL